MTADAVARVRRLRVPNHGGGVDGLEVHRPGVGEPACRRLPGYSHIRVRALDHRGPGGSGSASGWFWRRPWRWRTSAISARHGRTRSSGSVCSECSLPRSRHGRSSRRRGLHRRHRALARLLQRPWARRPGARRDDHPRGILGRPAPKRAPARRAPAPRTCAAGIVVPAQQPVEAQRRQQAARTVTGPPVVVPHCLPPPPRGGLLRADQDNERRARNREPHAERPEAHPESECAPWPR